MQVEKAKIKTGFACPRKAQDAIGICLIVAAQASGLMHYLYKFNDIRVEDPGIFRIRYQQPGRPLGDCFLERRDIGQPILILIEGNHLEPLHCCCCRIGRMREYGGNYLITRLCVSSAFVISPDNGSHRQNSRRTSSWLEGEFTHPRNFLEKRVQFVHYFQRTLSGIYVLQGMDLCDFDLVYAYPWPGEEDWLFELMRRHARPDAMLLTYEVCEGFRVTEDFDKPYFPG